MKSLIKKIFPRGSRGFAALKRLAIMLGLTTALPLHEIQYNDWTERVEPLTSSQPKQLSFNPLISIVVPVFNPREVDFMQMVYSVVNQTYDNWELVLVNASSDIAAQYATNKVADIDSRIKIVSITNLGIAGNTNAGIEQADGAYIGLLDHDDLLAPRALYEVALTLQARVKPKLIYSDEDKVTANGDYRVDPHFKPDWSPHLLRGLNYINHFTVIEAALLKQVGGYRMGFDGAQDYDLFLRITDETDRIAHIPKVLYHWRTAKTSTAENFSVKKDILDAGIRALEDHLSRGKMHGKVSAIKEQPGFYKINYTFPEAERISILVLPSQLKEEYRKFLFIFLEDLEKNKQQIDLYVAKQKIPIKTIPSNVQVHELAAKGRTQFINEAISRVSTDLTLIVGAGIFPIGKKWLKSLAGLLYQDPTIAVASAQIMAGDRETIIDSGFVKTTGGSLLPLFQGYPDEQHTPFGNSDWIRDIDVVSRRCFIIRSELLRSGVNELLPTGHLLFNPSYFEQLQRANQFIVLWPFARAVFAGDMDVPFQETGQFNSNLTVSKTEFTVFEAIRISRSYKDE